MQQQYSAVDGQSVLDVCLNTYGNLDQVAKLLQDNAFGSVNGNPYSGQLFQFDNDFIDSQVISTKLATLSSPITGNESAQALALISQRYATAVSAADPGSKQIVNINNMYKDTQQGAYTAGSEGETSIALPAWIGWDILSIEKEIQPLKTSGYTWNKSSGTLTLLSPYSLAKQETLFILFQKLITP